MQRYMLGQTVPLFLVTTNNSDVAVKPDDVPTYRVYSGSAFVKSGKMPPLDQTQVTGLFQTTLYLGSGFAEGFYTVVFTYAISSTVRSKTMTFRIEPGGDTDGHITSMYYYPRPNAKYVVQGLETGSIVKGRNPRV